jgi:hypothetical protein
MYILSVVTLPIITNNRNLVHAIDTYCATLRREQITIGPALGLGRRKEGTARPPMQAQPGIPGSPPLITIGT